MHIGPALSAAPSALTRVARAGRMPAVLWLLCLTTCSRSGMNRVAPPADASPDLLPDGSVAEADAADALTSDAGPDLGRDVISPEDARAVRIQTDAFDGWLGGSCQVNADCASSPAAEAVKGLHCPTEVFCLAGLCHAECIVSCAVAGTQLVPCMPPRFCVAFSTSGGMSFCRITPLRCTADTDCPLPGGLVDGGAAWSCTSGICELPGFSYPTQ